MRYMLIVKGNADTEAGTMPSDEIVEGIAKFNESLIERGLLISVEGLLPSSHGAVVRYSKAGITVTDGPFAEAKELIAGFWIVDVRSREEVIGLATQLMRQVPFEEGEEIEIRKVGEASDWPQDAGTEAAAGEKRA